MVLAQQVMRADKVLKQPVSQRVGPSHSRTLCTGMVALEGCKIVVESWAHQFTICFHTLGQKLRPQAIAVIAFLLCWGDQSGERESL